jgi:hypothetical protein
MVSDGQLLVDITVEISNLAGSLAAAIVVRSLPDAIRSDLNAAGTYDILDSGAAQGPGRHNLQNMHDRSLEEPTASFNYRFTFTTVAAPETQDGDDDGIADADDNCPLDANPSQQDTDRDEAGDACDVDDDNDTVADTADNCPLDANADQADGDGDGLGDVCDPETNADLDNDGVRDDADRCLPTPEGQVVDADGCSIAQLCPCDGPWQHRAAYLLCVAKTANDFRKDGLITRHELLKSVFEAGKSQCGKQPRKPRKWWQD